MRKAIAGELSTVSGVEVDAEDFTRIRFGQDRRLEEAARLLRSSSNATVKMPERPELKWVHMSRDGLSKLTALQ